MALAHNYLGLVAASQALAQNGLAQARALSARALEALFLNALSVIADSQGNKIASLEMDQQDLLINRELGNRRNEAIALGNLGHGWLELGAHAQARRMLEDSLRLARAISDHATQPNTLTNLSLLALRQGDDALALAQAGDLALVLVDADDVVAELGKARPRHQADIARADHRNPHGLSPSSAGTAPRASPRPCRRDAARPRRWPPGSRYGCRKRSAGRRSAGNGTAAGRSSSPWHR